MQRLTGSINFNQQLNNLQTDFEFGSVYLQNQPLNSPHNHHIRKRLISLTLFNLYVAMPQLSWGDQHEWLPCYKEM